MQLDASSSTSLYQQIYAHFSTGIEDGSYPQGGKLPSIRSLAEELQCSHNTVEAAYKLLAQEGYVRSKPGSGYIIQDVSFLQIGPSKQKKAKVNARRAKTSRTTRYDFTYGNLQTGTFPALTWRNITNDVLMSVDAEAIDAYGDALGEMSLRSEIAWRLLMIRGITCRPEQVVVQCGTQPSLQNLLLLFNPSVDRIAMEEPGYDAVREVMTHSGFPVVQCRVMSGEEAFLDDLEKGAPKLVYVTPSSQFPTTRILNMEGRTKLIEWAQRTDAYILEDDYCREFRYTERALPPLHTMAPDRVIYMGTFSKSVSPSLRVNYLVLPEALLVRWKEVFANAYPSVPWITQTVLARFISEGHRDRHLRKLQNRNKRKHAILVEALRTQMGHRVEVLENGTGLHVLVNVLDGRSQEELIGAARRYGVLVYDTNRYWSNPDNELNGCVLVGFSAIPEEDIEAGVAALAKAWFGE